MDETLHQAIAQLSPKMLDAIQMRDLDGFSTQEAANALGISTNALKSRLVRARANLNLLLNEVVGKRPAADATAGAAHLQPVE